MLYVMLFSVITAQQPKLVTVMSLIISRHGLRIAVGAVLDGSIAGVSFFSFLPYANTKLIFFLPAA